MSDRLVSVGARRPVGSSPGEEIRRIEGDLDRLCERAGRPVGRQSGHLHVELRVFGETVGKENGVAHRHSLAIGDLAWTANGTDDGHHGRGPEGGSGEEADLVLVLERQILTNFSR